MAKEIIDVIKKGREPRFDVLVVRFDGGYYRTMTRNNLNGTDKHYGPIMDGGKYILPENYDEFIRLWLDESYSVIKSKWFSLFMREKNTWRKVPIKVCDEWQNYIAFAKWYKNELSEYNGYSGTLEVDKNLFGGNSGIYSPRTCCLLPKDVNKFLYTGERQVRSSGVSYWFLFNGERVYAKSKEKAVSLLRDSLTKEAERYIEKYNGILPQRITTRLLEYAANPVYVMKDEKILRIKAACKEHGFRQKDLAPVLGISETSLSTAISEDRFSAKDLAKIADAIGAPITELFVKKDFLAIVRKDGETYTFEREADLKRFLSTDAIPLLKEFPTE